MLGSARAAVPRILPRRVPAGVRTVITKSERWTTETARNAQQIIEGPASQDLTKVLPNIEGMWPNMAKEEQYSVYKALEELQRKNWKELSVDEKKAGTFNAPRPRPFRAKSRLTRSLLCLVRPLRSPQARDGPWTERQDRLWCRRGCAARRGCLLRCPLDWYV